jgi:hypothetical protein
MPAMNEAAIGFVLTVQIANGYSTKTKRDVGNADEHLRQALVSNPERLQLQAELLEVVADVLPMQRIPFVIGQRAKEGVLRALGAGRRGETTDQVKEPLAVRFEITWRGLENLARRFGSLGKGDDIEKQVLEGKALKQLDIVRRHEKGT